jgi:hypothetical protein
MMTTTSRRLYSQSQLNTKGLNVVPELMGRAHSFDVEASAISIALPCLSDGKGNGNGRAEVDARIAATNEPVGYCIYEIDVKVSRNAAFPLPAEVLSRHPNAFDLFTDEEQGQLPLCQHK